MLALIFPLQSRTKRNVVWSLACLAAPLLLFAVWWVLTTNNGRPVYISEVSAVNAHPSAQVHYLIHHLNRFLEAFTNSSFLGWSDLLFASLIGVFGKLDTPLPLFFITMGYILIFITVFVNSAHEVKNETSILQRIKGLLPLQLIAYLTFVVGIYMSMYIYSTPVSEKIVTGVQGRYFLPLLPALVIFMPKNYLLMKRQAYIAVQAILPTLLMIGSVIVVVLRFYLQYP